MPNAHPYITNLTPLRGVAASWVAIYHFKAVAVVFQQFDNTRILAKGYLMVDLFFIMSGFIMLHVYGDSFTDHFSGRNFQKFIIARIARVYPLHIFTLLLLEGRSIVLNQWGGFFDPGAIPIHIFLLQSFGISRFVTWNLPSWSISAEWGAYLLFPFLAIFLYRRKSSANFILPAVALVLYLAIAFWLPRLEGWPSRLSRHNLDTTFDYGWLRGLAGFSIGLVIYGLYRNDKIRTFFSRDVVVLAAALLTLLCLHSAVNDLVTVASFPALILGVASNGGVMNKAFSARPLQFIGKVSYSIYMLQYLAQLAFIEILKAAIVNGVISPDGFKHFWPALGYTTVYIVFLIGLSTLTYYGIENPCRNLINRSFAKTQQHA